MEATIKNTDFIFFGLQPWDIELGSNCKNIAVEISKHNRVLYVNRPLDRISRLLKRKNRQVKSRSKAIRNRENHTHKVSDNLWVLDPNVLLESINWMPHNKIYAYFNKRNSKKLAEQVNEVAVQLGFKDAILFIDNDFFNGLYLKEYLKPRLLIYYIRDYLVSQTYFAKHGEKSEQAIMAKANIVAANSAYLAGYGARYSTNAVDIGQGCDAGDYVNDPGYIPADLREINKPLVGYCGALTVTRLDIDLIQKIARTNPQWNIVLVGPEDEAFKNSDLHKMSNVYFTGAKKVSELPAYVHHFDVCINPQLINQMTIGNYPRKVDEYLSAGKPVVATDTQTMQLFKDCTFLCNNLSEYCQAIESAIKESTMPEKIEQRREVGLSHTWEASVNKLYDSINNLSNE